MVLPGAMLLLVLSMQAICLLEGKIHSYWQTPDGAPKDVPNVENSNLRNVYSPTSPKWRHLPKSFTLEPSSCAEVNGPAAAAYSARYNFGWTKHEATTREDHKKTQAAIRKFAPQHYYQDPLHRASGSGIGSDLGEITSTDRTWLVGIIEAYNVTTMIDVPCGDVNWQMGAWETDSLSAYVGLDIVEPVIELNAARFGHHSNKRFARWDFASCALPTIVWPDASPRPADLVHARHVLQHMPRSRAAKAAYHLVASGARLVLVSGKFSSSNNRTTDKVHGARATTDVHEGEMWYNDMGLAPFFFPPPVSCSSQGMCAYLFDGYRSTWMAKYRLETGRYSLFSAGKIGLT